MKFNLLSRISFFLHNPIKWGKTKKKTCKWKVTMMYSNNAMRKNKLFVEDKAKENFGIVSFQVKN
jgi:hypothetical protein